MRQQKKYCSDLESKCRICGTTYGLEVHHMIHGYGRRKKADEYGLVCYLCRNCHRLLHDTRMCDLELQQEAQRKFEQDHSREEFIQVFGKSYI